MNLLSRGLSGVEIFEVRVVGVRREELLLVEEHVVDVLARVPEDGLGHALDLSVDGEDVAVEDLPPLDAAAVDDDVVGEFDADDRPLLDVPEAEPLTLDLFAGSERHVVAELHTTAPPGAAARSSIP